MSTHNPKGHDPHAGGEPEKSLKDGYEVTDVSTSGILVFLVALGISVSVFFVFCFGMGKVINNALVKSDGPANQWNQVETGNGKLRNLESNPALEQQQLGQLTQRFPSPRLQTDDGNQDLADLHDREDLLLNNYSWADQSQGKVRIPIERAMELIAQRGLPTAPKAETVTLMAGDSVPTVQMPLTDGFARTGYEQQQRDEMNASAEQVSTKAGK
jgi:hypothetical protein